MACRRTKRLAAFTLIELLVVIGIIAVLAGIGFAVGNGVIESSRAATTQNTIQLLEGYLSDLDATGEDKKSYKAFKTEFEGMDYELPVLDGRERGDGFDKADYPIDSLARFLSAGDQFLGDSSDRWGGLDSTVIRDVEFAVGASASLRGIALTDQWGRPIRAVHPSYDGGFGDYQNAAGTMAMRNELSVNETVAGSSNSLMFRRSYRPFASGSDQDSVGDADEGICQNERVYFYSAGPDGDPGTREDNVYSSTVTPQYPSETRDLD
jgi:prepilin-type N-terminal cleavage/methylation domain-containing protein